MVVSRLSRAEREQDRALSMWSIEREFRAAGVQIIAGVDEAGRGPLAGPLVVAAVILPFNCWLNGLNDSKQVAVRERERLAQEIRTEALAFAIEVIPVEVIDEINILRATYLGMRAALCALSMVPELALIDGLPLPDAPFPQQNLIKGDSRSASIAAASILAKVTRDLAMDELDRLYPQYGFSRHKGYPTPEHLQALQRHGVSPVHRRSYAPVRNCLQAAFVLDDTAFER